MAEVTRVSGKMQVDTKAATGSSGGGILDTKAAAGTFTPKIGGTKAGLNKEEASGGIGVTKAVFLDKAFLDKHLLKTGVAADPALRALLYKFAEEGAKPREQHRSERVVPPLTMTKHRMPDSYIESIKKRPMRKISPLPDSMYQDNPKLREFLQDTKADLDYLADLQEDCLRQHKEQGYAEIGVDYTDGVLKLYILPHQPQRKTTLVFVTGFAVLLVVLLSFLLLSCVSVQV